MTDKFEKAEAKFHFKGERLDLEIQALDSHLGTVTDKGYVTLNGRCDMAGSVKLNDKLLKLPESLAPIPFTTIGEQWDCKTRPDTQALAKVLLEVAKAEVVKKAREQLESRVRSQVPAQVQDQVGQKIKDLGKGLFGN